MSDYIVRTSHLSGTITPPPSKSQTLRSIVFALMAQGRSIIDNYLSSPDTESMLCAIELLGAKVKKDASQIVIDGVGARLQAAENIIDCGNSGQVLRFIGALAACHASYTVLTGDHSIRHNRPVKPLLSGLSQLGAFAASARQDDYAPIMIRGPITKDYAIIDGQDSQPVSGLIIAGSFCSHNITIEVTNPGEKPWIDLTLSWLDQLGISYTNENYKRYILNDNARYTGFHYDVPGDFSSAAYPIAAALITGSKITLRGLKMSDKQGDKRLIEVFRQMGAQIIEEGNLLHVRKSRLHGIEVNINDFIDSITILAVVSCFAKGKTNIYGAAIARKKESDRIHAIATELKKMGARIEEKQDGLLVEESNLRSATVNTYQDHRMILSLAVAGMGATDGPLIIKDVQQVAKTYGTFCHELRSLGANIEEKT
jgi:3-phosphoshikimate 1-carboxyvinyltransferase